MSMTPSNTSVQPSPSSAGVSTKRQRTREEVEDEILKKVLRVNVAYLQDATASSSSSQILYLEQLAAELLSEETPLLLSAKENVERAIMDRLTNVEQYAADVSYRMNDLEAPFPYLVNCYRRAVDEGRKILSIKDKGKRESLQEALKITKDLLVSYAGLSLQHRDMFPLPPSAALSRSRLRRQSPLTPFLLPPLEGSGGSDVVAFSPLSASFSSPSPTSLTEELPAGFLDALVARFEQEDDAIREIFGPLFVDISNRVRSVSLLGDFHSPLHSLSRLLSLPPLARCFTHHPFFIPPHYDSIISKYSREIRPPKKGPVRNGGKVGGASAAAGGDQEMRDVGAEGDRHVNQNNRSGSDIGGDSAETALPPSSSPLPPPPLPNGRHIEVSSLLGPFLRISVVPDSVLGNGKPDVRTQLFSNSSDRRKAEISSADLAVRTTSRQLWDDLHGIFRLLLKAPENRERVLMFIAVAIDTNAKRAQIQMDSTRLCSDGFFLNLSAVLLRLSEPFIVDVAKETDGSSDRGGKISKIDPSYVLRNWGRIDFSSLTSLHASREEFSSWVDQRNLARQRVFEQTQAEREREERGSLEREKERANASASLVSSNPFAPDFSLQSSSSSFPSLASHSSLSLSLSAPPSFSFICECFFMTARALHLGPIKIAHDFKNLSEHAGREDLVALAALEALRGPTAPPDLELRIEERRRKVDAANSFKLCYAAALFDSDLLGLTIRFYDFLLVWLGQLLGPDSFYVASLPVPCPLDFASMPEHFVEDAIDALTLATRGSYETLGAMEHIPRENFVSFMVLFLGSPLHIRNPYLRAKMLEVLELWMPKHCPSKAIATSMASLFEGHPIAILHLIPNLLQLFADIEFTGSHTAFYDKFTTRFRIADLLEYLWEVPSHKAAWIQLSLREERGFYLKFLSLSVNDSIFLLDEGLDLISKLRQREKERESGSPGEGESSGTVEERRQREEELQQMQRNARYDFQLANAYIRMMEYTTDQITRPFLLPEMVERFAAMLNYFVLLLVGPKRKELKISNAEKFEFDPKKILSQIVTIYVHLDKNDPEGVFAQAISADGRSYRKETFSAAASVCRTHSLLTENIVSAFENLGWKVEKFAADDEDMENMLGDIPEEFLDPVQFTLMRDPVILPSSKKVMDRKYILQHLLSDPRDPFSRSHLTPDMLTPHDELKRKIQDFIDSQKK